MNHRSSLVKGIEASSFYNNIYNSNENLNTIMSRSSVEYPYIVLH